ncbi:hypothetical protein FDECE_14647 [Fusarium decemcellulare]|nr:hypothetical protein FDECE_14647 [Fusarium decemcellulare]
MGRRNRKGNGPRPDTGHGHGQQQQAVQPQRIQIMNHGTSQDLFRIFGLNAGDSPSQPQMTAPPGPQNQGQFGGRGRGGGHRGHGGYRGRGNRGENAGQAAARPNPQTTAQQGPPSARRQPEERTAQAEPVGTEIRSLRAQLEAALKRSREAEEGRREAEQEVQRLKSECEAHETDTARVKDLEVEVDRMLFENADLWDDVHKASWHAAAAHEEATELKSNLDASMRSIDTLKRDMLAASSQVKELRNALAQNKSSMAKNEKLMVEKDRRLEVLSNDLERLQVRGRSASPETLTRDSMVLCRVFDDIAHKARQFPVFHDGHLDPDTAAVMGLAIGDDDSRRNVRQLLNDAPVGAWFCFDWICQHGLVAPQREHVCGTCSLHRDLCRLVMVTMVDGERQLRFFNPKD